MKKILRLTIPTGLFIIIILVLILRAPVSKAMAGNLSPVWDRTKPEQGGPAWYDSNWHYRRPVLIDNSGEFLSYYQVLIRLDNNNFDFEQAKPDGADVRFTHSDGTTALNYWIESWDSSHQLAYVWVRVPSISSSENTTIYLYYNNPIANPASDGASTFENFDDQWSQFVAGGHNQPATPPNVHLSDQVNGPFDWSILSGDPTASAGILSLIDGTGINSTSTYLYNAIGYKAKYSLGSVDEWIGFINGVNGARTIIGDSKPGNVDDLFLIDSVNGLNFENVIIPKGGGGNWHGGYHVYEVRWKSGQSTANVDHTETISSTIPAYVPSGYLPVTLYNDTLPNGTLQVDWVYIRLFRDPEPTTSVQGEQGLVELSIDNNGYPNPLRKLTKLTYQLTIANTSSIDAPGVLVTDTLPSNIQIGPVSTSQGSCEPGSIILCDLDTIQANSTASITIIVTPTLDGDLINTAEVGSPSKELDYSDNTSEQSTLVDSLPPEVNWVKPVADGEIYFSLGGMILLETTAIDNDQVDRVEFWWYDGVSYWPIATVTAPPYQADFNSKLLTPGIPYWFEARAYDRAGNSNFPYDRAFIYIIRNNKNFLPLVRR